MTITLDDELVDKIAAHLGTYDEEVIKAWVIEVLTREVERWERERQQEQQAKVE